MYEQYVSALADLFFPQRCVGCDRRASDLLCRECFEALPTRRRVSCPLCARCETPTAFETLVCDACKGLDFGFESVRTPLRYEGVGDEIVHALKYCDYAKVIESQEAGCTADARGAQPRRVLRRRRARAALHRSRLGRRGFNQAELLARGVAAGLAALVFDTLEVVRRTRDQVELTAAERGGRTSRELTQSAAACGAGSSSSRTSSPPARR